MRYDADGESWDVYLSEEEPREGMHPLIFHCTTNSSHGWRVVEVPSSELPAGGDLEALDETRLAELYDRSQPFDYSHDPQATETHVGDPGTREPHSPGPGGSGRQ